jgi:hypothetical protein
MGAHAYTLGTSVWIYAIKGVHSASGPVVVSQRKNKAVAVDAGRNHPCTAGTHFACIFDQAALCWAGNFRRQSGFLLDLDGIRAAAIRKPASEGSDREPRTPLVCSVHDRRHQFSPKQVGLFLGVLASDAGVLLLDVLDEWWQSSLALQRECHGPDLLPSDRLAIGKYRDSVWHPDLLVAVPVDGTGIFRSIAHPFGESFCSRVRLGFRFPSGVF